MLNAMPKKRSPGRSWRKELAARLREKDARVGVVGLGYVGLPMLVAAVRAGYRGVGVDVDASRIAAIKEALTGGEGRAESPTCTARSLRRRGERRPADPPVVALGAAPIS